MKGSNCTYKRYAYELSNHFGNVLSVISDKPIPHVSAGSVAYYKADILQSQDFSPFGVKLKGRNLNKTGNTELYRRGFQGQEEDDELKGDGNSLNYEYRMHDPRLGRYFAIDTYTKRFPFYSPYHYSSNSTIMSKELDGCESDYIVNITEKIGEVITFIVYAGAKIYLHSKITDDFVPDVLKDKYLNNVDGVFLGGTFTGTLVTLTSFVLMHGKMNNPLWKASFIGEGAFLSIALIAKEALVIEARIVSKRIEQHSKEYYGNSERIAQIDREIEACNNSEKDPTEIDYLRKRSVQLASEYDLFKRSLISDQKKIQSISVQINLYACKDNVNSSDKKNIVYNEKQLYQTLENDVYKNRVNNFIAVSNELNIVKQRLADIQCTVELNNLFYERKKLVERNRSIKYDVVK